MEKTITQERYKKVNKNIVWDQPWCGVFAYWVWAKAGVTKLPRMKARAGDRSEAQGHWATYWHGWAKAHDRWKPIGKRNPWIGDLVVYGKWRKDGPDNGHIGVVVDVKYDRNGKVTKVRTVEGNSGNSSDRVTDLGWRKITELTGNGHPASGFVSPI